jgi:hypothetical protein
VPGLIRPVHPLNPPHSKTLLPLDEPVTDQLSMWCPVCGADMPPGVYTGCLPAPGSRVPEDLPRQGRSGQRGTLVVGHERRRRFRVVCLSRLGDMRSADHDQAVEAGRRRYARHGRPASW